MTKTRWTVCKRDGRWRVLDRGCWHDTFDSLEEAHTFAQQCAVTDILFEPGGLTILKALLALSSPPKEEHPNGSTNMCDEEQTSSAGQAPPEKSNQEAPTEEQTPASQGTPAHRANQDPQTGDQL